MQLKETKGKTLVIILIKYYFYDLENKNLLAFAQVEFRKKNLKSHVVYGIFVLDLNPLTSARLAIILPREQQSNRDLIFRSDSTLATAAVCQYF